MTTDNTIKIIKDLIKLGLISKNSKRESKRRSRKDSYYPKEHISRVGRMRGRMYRERKQQLPRYAQGSQTFTQTPAKHLSDEQASINIELGKKALTNNQTLVSSVQPRSTIKDDERYEYLDNKVNKLGYGFQSIYDNELQPMVSNFQSQNNNPKIKTSTRVQPMIKVHEILSTGKRALVNEYKKAGGKSGNIHILTDSQIQNIIDLINEATSKGIPIESIEKTTSAKTIKRLIDATNTTNIPVQPEYVVDEVNDIIPTPQVTPQVTSKKEYKESAEDVDESVKEDEVQWEYYDEPVVEKESPVEDVVKSEVKVKQPVTIVSEETEPVAPIAPIVEDVSTDKPLNLQSAKSIVLEIARKKEKLNDYDGRTLKIDEIIAELEESDIPQKVKIFMEKYQKVAAEKAAAAAEKAAAAKKVAPEKVTPKKVATKKVATKSKG